MTKATVVGQRPLTALEEQREAWLVKQALDSPANLEAAARQIVTLVTALLAVLFTVLALDADPAPAYLALPLLRWLGAGSVILLLAALLASLFAILPRRYEVALAQPEAQNEMFIALLRRKSLALSAAVVLFFLGLAALGGVLVVAILNR